MKLGLVRFETSPNEMLSITTVARGLGKIMDQLKSRVLEKIIILKNNEASAVILPIEEYLMLKEMAEQAELISIGKIMEERTTKGKFINKDELFEKLDKLRPLT
jgi:PHD/YefM family antitoxin component YafN of YafNO toxin-antitoxin module